MNPRIRSLRDLQPGKNGRASYEAILEAAAGLFQQIPADAIALRDILAVAGVSNQTLYNHFPEGRDDVAIVLYDRFQRTIVHEFRNLAQGFRAQLPAGAPARAAGLAASFAQACFGYLKDHRPALAGVLTYLDQHGLTPIATHREELAAALEMELRELFQEHLAEDRRTWAATICTALARDLGELALRSPGTPVDDFQVEARRMVRAKLLAEMDHDNPPSGGHPVADCAPPSIAVQPSRLSEQKRRTILDRLRRRRRPS